MNLSLNGRAADGCAPEPLRQATELSMQDVCALIGTPVGGSVRAQARLAEVIWRHYCNRQAAHLSEIGRAFGVTTERVRQLEANALRLLRYPDRHAAVRETVRTDTRLWHAIHHGAGGGRAFPDGGTDARATSADRPRIRRDVEHVTFRPGALGGDLLDRGTPSSVAKAMVARYLMMIRAGLERLSNNEVFVPDEKRLIIGLLQGYPVDGESIERMPACVIERAIAEGLDETAHFDLHAVYARLRDLTWVERLALIDAAERVWRDPADSEALRQVGLGPPDRSSNLDRWSQPGPGAGSGDEEVAHAPARRPALRVVSIAGAR
jgi:hypothetical protein